MTELFAALSVFIAFHVIPAIRPVRAGLVRAVGLPGYIVGYSFLSIALLVWVGVAFDRADTDLLWAQQIWMRWVPVGVMPLACLLLVGSLSAPNPLSVGVKADRFDPVRPGIVSITRHPLMWALVLWAGAHVPPNGDTAALALFGLFVLLGAIGPWSLDRKKRRDLGEDAWKRLSAGTSSVPFWAILCGRTRLDLSGIGWRQAGVAAVLYVGFLAAHEWALGVSPLPY